MTFYRFCMKPSTFSWLSITDVTLSATRSKLIPELMKMFVLTVLINIFELGWTCLVNLWLSLHWNSAIFVKWVTGLLNMGQSPLHNRSFVLDPETGPFFMGFHWAIGETADILLQHPSLVFISCINLRQKNNIFTLGSNGLKLLTLNSKA